MPQATLYLQDLQLQGPALNSEVVNGMVKIMPQRQPIFFQNGYYHVYNRGHNKQPIFLNYKDYVRYITRLKEYLKKHAVTILAYCLMPNHIHFLIRQDTEESIERFIHRLHTAYTMYFNKKYEYVGSVFQSRFKAKLVESDDYLLHVSRYIHLNPVELLHAQGPALNSELASYPWSSYHEYVHNVSPPLVVSNPSIILDYFKKEHQKESYRKFVEDMIKNLSEDHLTEISEGKL